ncbi:MAG: cation transporter [Deltaproteobacteria bacterium]|nr:MAG: cation transporter [Deltaproteobacteria bacterium]
MERTTEINRLTWALAITTVYFFAELIGGLLTNSLALLSDAGHMLSDIAALGLSLFAFRMARRPATAQKTYGYHRLEIVVALLNGLALWLVVGMIFHAAYNRLFDPPEVESLGMLVIAAIGLGVNIAAGAILYGSHHECLNLQGALLHVISDALGSIGAIAAAMIMLMTSWTIADPIISIFIGLLILYTSWSPIKESIGILMQSVPRGIDLGRVQEAIVQVRGVIQVHDLHVWSVTSGVFTLTAHAVIDGRENLQQVLNEIEGVLKDRFRIEHTTIQLETEDRGEREFQAF